MTNKGFLKIDIISISATVLIWIIFLIVSLVIEPKQETRYEMIQLILEEEQVVKVVEPVIEPEPLPVPLTPVLTQTKPAAQAKPAAPAAAVPKAETQKTPASQPKRAEPQLVQSVEDIMKQNAQPVKKEAVWDDSLFEKAVEQTSKEVPVPSTANTKPEPIQALSGTAATSQTDTSAAVAGLTSRNTGSSSVSGTTAGLLQNIASAKPSIYTQEGSASGVSFETQSSSRAEGGGVAMDLEDGSSRRLLYPSKPAIVLSPESEKLITSSRTLTIVFVVLANGTVPPGNISFQPASLLPVSVQTEIRAQIAQWKFEEEKSDGQARLTYSINVK